MKAIEFYTTPEGEVTMRPIGEAERQLKETDTDFIQAFLAILREFYPEAYDALMDIYSKNSNNKRYRDFIAARRFIKCNFGLYDNMIDVDENWNFNFEFHYVENANMIKLFALLNSTPSCPIGK